MTVWVFSSKCCNMGQILFVFAYIFSKFKRFMHFARFYFCEFTLVNFVILIFVFVNFILQDSLILRVGVRLRMEFLTGLISVIKLFVGFRHLA